MIRDEQEKTDAFERALGVDRARRLSRILKNSHPSQDHWCRPISRQEVFRRAALRDNFTPAEIDALLELQG